MMDSLNEQIEKLKKMIQKQEITVMQE